MTWKFTLHLILLATSVFVLSAVADNAHAQYQSLWERRAPALTDQFSDVKARRPGDLLVVLINERSDVENRDRRLMQKQTAANADFSANYGASGDIGAAAGGVSLDHDSTSQRDFNGNTQFTSEREFLDRFTVTVIDETPNGNLLIKGTRQVSLEGDRKNLVLTGMVRSVDIFFDNTISSRQVYDLDIRYEADQGSERSFVNQGWLARKLNRWWPY